VSDPVAVRILDKEYLVACPEDEREGLLAASRLLDERLRSMRQSQRMAPLERIAVLAALNLAHERLQAEQNAARREAELTGGLGALELRVEQVLREIG
jgi:cell division protein ZapA